MLKIVIQRFQEWRKESVGRKEEEENEEREERKRKGLMTIRWDRSDDIGQTGKWEIERIGLRANHLVIAVIGALRYGYLGWITSIIKYCLVVEKVMVLKGMERIGKRGRAE